MFDGFVTERVDVGEVDLVVRHGGGGPSRLVAAGFAVVGADLRGYGRSGRPTPTADRRPHAKRAAGGGLVRLVAALSAFSGRGGSP